MRHQAVTKPKEAGLKPASFSFNDFSATSHCLVAGTFTTVFFSGLNLLFLSNSGNNEIQRMGLLFMPVAAQCLAYTALLLYRKRGRGQFRAFVEEKMKEIDVKISTLPKRKTPEVLKQLEKLEDKRDYWEELLDFNTRAYIHVD